MKQGQAAWVLRSLRVLLALAALYGAYRGQLLLGRARFTEGLVYFVIAAGVLILAQLRRPSPRAEDGQTALPPASLYARLQAGVPLTTLGWWALVLASIGVGLFFRFYQLDSQPWGVWFDEAQNGLVAQRILTDPHYRPVFIGNLSQLPALFFYAFAVSIKFLGLNIFALRLVTTVAGVLTLIFIYLLARELFDPRVALLATLLLGMMRWHVNFSRFAMHGVFMPLFMTATLYFLVRGLRGRNVGNFAAAGVMAGMGLQGYYSFLLVPGVIGLYLLHYVVFQRTISWSRLFAGVGTMIVLTAVVYGPLALWAYKHPLEFSNRLNTVTITSNRTWEEVAQVLWDSTQKHLEMFNWRGDFNGRHNLPGAPMLDLYTGFLFVLGIGYALWCWRQSGYFLLLVWMAVILQGGIWSLEWEAPQGYRTIGVTPAVAMLAALPLAVIWHLSADLIESLSFPKRWFARLPAYVVGGAVAAAAVGAGLFILARAGWLNFDTYFHKQLRNPGAWASYSTDATFVGYELRRLGGSHEVYCSAFLQGLPTVVFLSQGVPAPRRFDLARDLPFENAKPIAVLLSNNERAAFELIKRYYPNGEYTEFGPPDGGAPIVFEAVLSAEDIEATRGVTYRYQSPTASLEGRVDAVDLDWQLDQPLPLPMQAEWVGFIKVPSYASYMFEVRAPGSVELRLDGKLVATGEQTASSEAMTLAQGLHDIQMFADVREPGTIQLLWGKHPKFLTPVNSARLFSAPVQPQGLEGFYSAPEGTLRFVRIDPVVGGHFHILPLDVPYGIRWEGKLHVPTSGHYRFVIQAVDEATLTIDRTHVATTPAPNDPANLSVDMSQGDHDIEIVFHQRGGSPAYMNLYWNVPSRGFQPIPDEQFSPPL